jgi:hypothetical protein
LAEKRVGVAGEQLGLGKLERCSPAHTVINSMQRYLVLARAFPRAAGASAYARQLSAALLS